MVVPGMNLGVQESVILRSLVAIFALAMFAVSGSFLRVLILLFQLFPVALVMDKRRIAQGCLPPLCREDLRRRSLPTMPVDAIVQLDQ